MHSTAESHKNTRSKLHALKHYEIYIVTILVAFSSIVYQLMLAQGLALTFGNSTIRYSVTIGLYLFGLGGGAEFSKYASSKALHKFIIIEYALSVIGGFSIIFLFWIAQFQFFYEFIIFVTAHFLVLLIGFLSGLELPLLYYMARLNNIYRILSLDYIGSLLGGVLFGVYFYSLLGLVTTSIIVAIINMLVAVYLTLKLRPRHSTILLLVAVSFCVVIVVKGPLLGDHTKQAFIKNSIYYDYYWHSLTWHDVKRHVDKEYIKNNIKNTYIENFLNRSSDKKYFPQNIDIKDEFFTPYQWIVYAVLEGHETRHSLFLDNNAQIESNWTKQYHDMFELMGLAYKQNDKLNIAVVGNGDLQLIEKLLSSGKTNNIDHIDIDKEFVDYIKNHSYFKKYLKEIYQKSDKWKSYYQDALYYFRERDHAQQDYDLVFIDLASLTHNFKALPLYSLEFYKAINLNLKPKGAVVIWSYENKDFVEILKSTMKEAGFKYYGLGNSFYLDSGIPMQSYYIFTKTKLNKNKYKSMNGYQKKLFKYITPLNRLEASARPNSIFQPNYKMVKNSHMNVFPAHPEILKLHERARRELK